MRVCEVCKRCYSNDAGLCSAEGHSKLSDLGSFGPDVIAGYHIEELISSVMGVSRFRAKQIQTNSDCVISIISLGHADADEFLAEGKLAADLVHPALATIYEYGILDSDGGFLISEFSSFGTVGDLLRESATPQILTSIQIVRQLAEAVEVLHSIGLVHGAIRPENILLSDTNGQVRITLQHPDLAAAVRNSVLSDRLTPCDSIETLKYLSPEHLTPGRNEQSGDVYALGIVLFELLSGNPPFVGESAEELIEKQRNEHPPEIKIPDYELRMLLANTLMESLQKQASLRMPTALAFARQMRHIEQLATHSSTPPPAMNAPRLKARSAAAFGTQQAQQLTDEVILLASRPERTAPKKIEPAAVESLLEQSSPASLVSVRNNENVAALGSDAEEDLNRFRLNYWKEKYNKHVSKTKNPTTSNQRWDSILNLDAPVKLTSSKAAALTPVERKERPIERKRIKIEWQQPADDVPTMDDVRKTLASAPIAQPSSVKQIVEPAKLSLNNHSGAKPLALQQPIGKAPASTVAPDLFAFVAQAAARSKTPVGSTIFRGSTPASLLSSIDRRILVAAASGFFVLAILFSVYTFSGGEEQKVKIEPAKPAEIALPAAPVQESRHTATQVDDRVEDVPMFAPNSKASGEQNEKDLRVVKAKADEPAVKVSSNGTAAPTNSPVKMSADVVTTPVASAALKPSTLVISANNGRVDKRVYLSDAATAKRVTSNQSNAAGATRPRIVANPKP